MAQSGTNTVDKARAAFIELVRKRDRPTAAKIRSLIGGGGTDLIQRVIREMEDELYAKMFDAANRPEVPGAIVDQIVRIWESANDCADQRFEAARTEYDQRIQAAEASKEAALVRAEEQAVRIQAQDEQISAKTGEVSALRTALDTGENRITGLQNLVESKIEESERIRLDAETRIQAASSRLEEQERLSEERYRGLERHLLENFDRERTQLHRESENMKKEISTLNTQRNVLDQEKKEFAVNLLRARDANMELTAQLSETKGLLTAITNECASTKRELVDTRQRLVTTERQLESWKRRARQAEK